MTSRNKAALPKDLTFRFGSPAYYEDSFDEIDRSKMGEDFDKFDSSKTSKNSLVDHYEVSRQLFLRLLGQHKMIWHKTSEECDMGVDISRIYCQDRREYLAFMRLQPRGFRAERLVPSGVEIIFHLLVGRAVFTCKKRVRTMSKGQHITVPSKGTYTIRCLEQDRPTYFIFKIVDKNRKKD